jgi:hypothetical protein
VLNKQKNKKRLNTKKQSPLASQNSTQGNLSSKQLKRQNRRLIRRKQLALKQQQQTTQPQELKLKPMDAFYSQLDQRKLAQSRFDSLNFINSVCLSLQLSDTLLNAYRDINFDSCTLCVCTNNNIKGLDYPIYICEDIFDTDENGVNAHNPSSSHHAMNNGGGNLANQSSMSGGACGGTTVTNNNSCTCGFSSIVNRGIMAKSARTVRLNNLLEVLNKLKLKDEDKEQLMPYSSLVKL